MVLSGGSGLSGRQGYSREDVQPSAAQQGLSQHTRMGSSALSKPGFEGVSPLTPSGTGAGGSLADTSLNLELDATVQKAPQQEGTGSWGTGTSHSPAPFSPALMAPPAPEFTLRHTRILESPFQHQLPAVSKVTGNEPAQFGLSCHSLASSSQGIPPRQNPSSSCPPPPANIGFISGQYLVLPCLSSPPAQGANPVEPPDPVFLAHVWL